MCDSGDMPKKPRLFYWEEAEDAWCPAEGLSVDQIIEASQIFHDGEISMVQFKRVDMTDEEYDAIPEG